MGIRSNNNTKNQLRRELRPAPTLVAPSITAAAVPQNPLRFRTEHPLKPYFVDLTQFEQGQKHPKRKREWLGSFSGRPELIKELTPAIQDHLLPLIDGSVTNYIRTLRTWWRMFDKLESAAPGSQRLTSTAQLTDLHRQSAMDQGMDRLDFGRFLSLANTTRIALGLGQLHWQAPEREAVIRHLPAQWQCDAVRHALKHRWFAVLDRWALADALLKSTTPLLQEESDPTVYAEQERLLKNYQRFEAIVTASGQARPLTKALYADLSSTWFNSQGYHVSDMCDGRYPNGSDIRAAFHLCLATTGWNPAVLLSLDVGKPFIEVHPKDERRYVLRGTKVRAGGAEQVSEGLFKSQGSAGVILQTLMERTAPLREQLRRELEVRKAELQEFSGPENSPEVEKLLKRITTLEQGLRSPWLYTPQRSSDISFLDDSNQGVLFDGQMRSSYLGTLVDTLNKRQPAERQLSPMKSGDLRDAYAAYIYRSSAGSILAVMKALGHRRVDTTQIYLHNTLLQEEHRKLFGTFSQALWSEIMSSGRVDPTVLAKWSRDGEMTPQHRERLHTYRTLMLSRIGVGCKDPHNPPQHIAPSFEADGKTRCHVQRCTLCIENAVILPESMPGLCKRLAELRHLHTRMGVGPFQESSFLDETKNTEIALQAFDPIQVKKHITDWTARIKNGVHRFIEFDGSSNGAGQ